MITHKMITQKTYRQTKEKIDFMNRLIKLMINEYKMPKEYLKYNLFNIGYRVHMTDADREIIQKYEDTFDIDDLHFNDRVLWKCNNFVKGMGTEIGNLRSRVNKRLGNYDPSSENTTFQKVWTRTKHVAEDVLNYLFKRSYFEVIKFKEGAFLEDDDLDKTINRYSWRSTELKIPLLWYKTVYEQGLAAIHGTKGKLFTLQIQKLNRFPSIEYEMPECDIFKAKVLLVKNKRASIEEGYLLVNNYNNPDIPKIKINAEPSQYKNLLNMEEKSIYNWYGETDKKIHAFGSNLKKTAILLNRRIKGEILKNI